MLQDAHTCCWGSLLPVAPQMDFVHCSIPLARAELGPHPCQELAPGQRLGERKRKKKPFPVHCFKDVPLKVLRDYNNLSLRLLLLGFM